MTKGNSRRRQTNTREARIRREAAIFADELQEVRSNLLLERHELGCVST